MTGPLASVLATAPSDRVVERVVFSLPLSENDELRVASGVYSLCRCSRVHVHYTSEMFRRRFEPLLRLGQFHYHEDSLGLPVGFCGWAWLSASVLQEVLATGRDLHEEEFNCGELPFFYEFLAPFGHCRAVVRELRRQPCFQGRHIPCIRSELGSVLPGKPRVEYFRFSAPLVART